MATTLTPRASEGIAEEPSPARRIGIDCPLSEHELLLEMTFADHPRLIRPRIVYNLTPRLPQWSPLLNSGRLFRDSKLVAN